MNCRECIEELSTTSLREMTADSAVMQHCATCPDCAQLTTGLRQREYEAATVLNSLPPLSNPLSVAETAATLARRRGVGRVVVMTSGIVGAIIIGLVSSTMIIPAMFRAGVLPDGPSPSHLRTETITLSCLSPEQAADIIDPYVRAQGAAYWTPSSGISAITVRAPVEQLSHARALIHDFENDPSAACRRNSLGQSLKGLQKELERATSADARPEIAQPTAVAPTRPKK